MKNYKYSIIIPHKNIPDLLERCLATIPDSEDFQVIIVDDNSDPLKVDFSNFPGQNRRNTEFYLDKQGKGAGYARNIGLKHAKGKWLIFADADDFFNGCLEAACKQYFDSDPDVIYFSATSVNNYSLTPGDRHLGLEKIILNYDPSNFETIEAVKFSNWSPFSRMFRHDFVVKNNITFDEVRVGNDAGFVLKAGINAKKILVDLRPLYCISYRKDSLTFKPGKAAFEDRFKAKLLVNTYMMKFKKGYYRPMKEELITAITKYGPLKFLQLMFVARKYFLFKMKLKLKLIKPHSSAVNN